MAMRILTLAVGATSAVSAASSSSRISAIGGQTSTHRTLQSDGASYTHLDDLTGYSLQYSNCIRVKIPQENDDDAVDGNVNFYNGRYHAQYQVFATFHVCDDGSGANQCSSCDYGVEYATDMNQYLDSSLEHWENYCGACENACRRRRLEDEAGAEDDIDCNTCSNACAKYQVGDDNEDESAYTECGAGAVDEDGLQYYYGPQCSDEGKIIIGVFYDDECTIKTKHDSPNFDYYKFGTVSNGCVDCSSEQGAETCGDLYDESFHCLNGNDQQGADDDMRVCSTVKKALTNMDYSGAKKRHAGSEAFVRVFLMILLTSFVGGLLFLSYTYFIRHTGEKSQPMLSSEDVHEDAPEDVQGGTLT